MNHNKLKPNKLKPKCMNCGRSISKGKYLINQHNRSIDLPLCGFCKNGYYNHMAKVIAKNYKDNQIDVIKISINWGGNNVM